MRVTFRTDASSQIGTGHVVRCLTLADALREQGAECQFVCREHEGHLMDHICSRGYQVDALPRADANASSESDLAHADWLGVDWSTDAREMQQLTADTKFDWLIVDHYALDHRWESALRSSCKRIMAIDDLADRQHDCDLLLDQNYGSSAGRYLGLVRANCIQCHGPEYALLKPVYAERRAQLSVRNGQVNRALIYFGGGADAADLTGIATRAFQVPELADIALDIVVGAAYAHQLSLEELVAKRGNATIHRQLPDLAELMVRADLAVGAGGATTWERCCLGLPTIMVSIAENQNATSEYLSRQEVIHLVEMDIFRSVTRLSSEIIGLTNSQGSLSDLSEKSRTVTDGLGVTRIIEKMAAFEIHE